VTVDLHQLRCFVAVAEELHFGRAAQRMRMLPTALGRHVRLLEEDLGTRLLTRTTRSAALTEAGAVLLEEARALLAQAESVASRIRQLGRGGAATLRLGAIDSAAAGLVPLLLHDFRLKRPDVAVQLVEDKTIRLIPRLLSGRLDLAFVRPPSSPSERLEFRFLFHETVVVAMPTRHRLARRRRISILDLADEPLIVPDRRSRPHSHDVTIGLFAEAGLQPRIAQLAEEKQTIVNFVAAELGVALVPRWTSRLATPGVRYIPLDERGAEKVRKLPLAVALARDLRDPVRDDLLATLSERLAVYAAEA
jgi:DNA-binding transcriptional LysR family regulator